MKTRIASLGLCALLAACGEDFEKMSYDWTTSDLVYSYPYDGQKAVPTSAPIVLRFSHALEYADDAELAAAIDDGVITLVTSDGTNVALDGRLSDDGFGLVLEPEAGSFVPATSYQLSLNAFATAKGEVVVPDAPIDFVTRIAEEGPERHRKIVGEPFGIDRLLPDGEFYPLMDFSTLRVGFTENIDDTTLVYANPGDNTQASVALMDGAGALVEAVVLADGAYLTVDPAEDLTPGESYTLIINNQLKSESGRAFAAGDDDIFQHAFAPKSSHPREVMVQQAPVSGDLEDDNCTANATLLSALTDGPVNCVPVKATLLGEESSSQQSGDVHAELAFVPNFPDVTPLRIKRGSLLKGSKVDVLVAGGVPAGFDTGDITVNFISDAMGYLMPNPYSRGTASPRHVHLVMDVSMTAENNKANGGLSQGLMQVELVGTSLVEDGVMTIDAVGVVEPRVMGVENAYGVLSFHMRAYADQANAPDPLADTEAPYLQSWMPGVDEATAEDPYEELASAMRPGDPIILNFSEALDPRSLAAPGAVTINGGSAFDWELDGASLILRPHGELEFNDTYEVAITQDVTDLAGNPLVLEEPVTGASTLQFTMPPFVSPSGSTYPWPVVTTVWPGYPCVTTDRDLAGGDGQPDHGRCLGGATADDRLPIAPLEANEPILVHFSQELDPATVTLGESFVVVEQDSGAEVEGRLEFDARTLRFWPREPWAEGVLYRYTLCSNLNTTGCQTTMMSVHGSPLQTNLLAAPGSGAGGPDMEIVFRGAPHEADVTQPLRNLPTFDVNANFMHDDIEPDAVLGDDGRAVVPMNASHLKVESYGGIVSNARIGCSTSGPDCPRDKLIHLTGSLMSEVVGDFVEDAVDVYEDGTVLADAVTVNIYPPVTYTTEAVTYANISVLLGAEEETPTGPQIMRGRYADTDGDGFRGEPLPGYIYTHPDSGQTHLRTRLQLYLDAPYMTVTAGGSHNLHSYPFELILDGPIVFYEDGRMTIIQRNLNTVDLNIEISAMGMPGNIQVRMEPGDTNLTFLPLPVKQ